MTADEVVEFAEDLARVASGGGGMNALALELATATGGAVLVEDVDRRPIATAGTAALPARALDIREMQTLPIAVNGTTLGYVSSTVPGDDAKALLRLTASALAVELSRDVFGGGGRQHGFWERAIDGSMSDVAALREDAGARGIALANTYVCVAVESEDGVALAALLHDVFRQNDGALGVVERGTRCIALVPAAREIDVANARTAAMLLPKSAAKRQITESLAGGISNAVHVGDLQGGVNAAQAALAIVRKFYGFGRVASYDDLGAYPLLYHGADAEALRAFSRRTLEPLRDYDEKHQTELERTLRTYFASGQNVKTAAAELAVHRHTVFYRLRQINDITKRTLENERDQLTLRLAIAIDALNT